MNAQSMDWNDIHLILTICEQGSLSGAARKLNINHSTVFRRITAIEEKLDVRLFDRLNNRYVMTEAGSAVLDYGQRIENEVLGLTNELIGKDLRLKGTLRITAPESLLSILIMPIVAEFSKLYPDINLEIDNGNNNLNLRKREADIAIRPTNTPPSTFAGKKICNLASGIYGSIDYLSSIKGSALNELSWLMPGGELKQLTVNKWLKKNHPDASVQLYSNSICNLYNAVKLNMGVAPLPCFLGDQEETFKCVLGPIDDLTVELWILFHPDLRKTSRVRAFIDFFSYAIESKINKISGLVTN